MVALGYIMLGVLASVLVYCLLPRHWKPVGRDPQYLSTTHIVQALARRERKIKY